MNEKIRKYMYLKNDINLIERKVPKESDLENLSKFVKDIILLVPSQAPSHSNTISFTIILCVIVEYCQIKLTCPIII